MSCSLIGGVLQPSKHLPGLIWACSTRSQFFLCWGTRAGHMEGKRQRRGKFEDDSVALFRACLIVGIRISPLQFILPVPCAYSTLLRRNPSEQQLELELWPWDVPSAPLQTLLFPEGENELLVDEKSMMDQTPTAPSTEQGKDKEVQNKDPRKGCGVTTAKTPQPTPISQLSCNKSTTTNISLVSADLLWSFVFNEFSDNTFREWAKAHELLQRSTLEAVLNYYPVIVPHSPFQEWLLQALLFSLIHILN